METQQEVNMTTFFATAPLVGIQFEVLTIITWLTALEDVVLV